MGPQDAPGSEARVEAARRGDREAISALWREHRRWVAAVLLAHKPSFVDLEDLLQDVAMTMVKRIHTLRDTTNARAWLRTVAVNAARASARSGKLRQHAPLPNSDTHPGLGPIDEALAGHEQVRNVLEAAARLPEAYREPLMLRAIQGMRSRQISEILGIPEPTVDTRVARARRLLREQMCDVADGADEPNERRPTQAPAGVSDDEP